MSSTFRAVTRAAWRVGGEDSVVLELDVVLDAAFANDPAGNDPDERAAVRYQGHMIEHGVPGGAKVECATLDVVSRIGDYLDRDRLPQRGAISGEKRLGLGRQTERLERYRY